MNGLSATQSLLSLAVRPFQRLAARWSHREPVPEVVSGFVHDVDTGWTPEELAEQIAIDEEVAEAIEEYERRYFE